MIIDILTSEEFTESGLSLLNLAWSIGMEIVRELEEADVEEWDSDGNVRDEYWRQSQPALGNALALVQQSQEMALKGKIAAVSPYLLIGRDPRDWPKRSENEDIPFSMFRTLDAADLIKVYNTVCPTSSRFGGDFRTIFENIRQQRNAIVHVGGTGRRMQVAELFVQVLQTNEYLDPGVPWTTRRYDYLSEDRVSIAYASDDYAGYMLITEFDIAARRLKPADAKRFFNLSKARRFICPHCKYNAGKMLIDQIVRLAQLTPNTPSATTISCFACDKNTIVARRACVKEGCKSNVICAEPDYESICLVCGIEQDKLG